MIYADNAATSRLKTKALEAMLPFFGDGFGNPSSLHSVGQRANAALFAAREKAAKCLGAAPNEIYFTSGGSEADNQAILTGAKIGGRKGKKHIISTAFEHHAVLHTLDRMKKDGFEITLLPVGEKGLVTPEQVAEAIRPDTALVTVMFANNEIGTVQPIGEIAAVCREKGVLFHTDAVQAVGHIKVDVASLGVDMLSLSAHKFGGPTGTGILFARKGIKPEILIEGGAQERGRRAGTENLAAIVGMAAALEESCAKIEENAVKVSAMRNRLIEGLGEIPHGILNGDRERRLPGNVNFCFEGIEGESLLLLLDDEGICASSGSACTSGSLDPSHVLLAIGRPHEIAHGSLRLTINEDNTPEQMEKIIASTKKVVERLRAMSPVWRDLVSGKKEFVIK
ncbi:MAG: aminotransferase class V-fold PLP-dependent enzyme [Clostridia bacterium]|nr:aminotransferase class V-fold PLP-dependent enzyme [Clostridia bacterium]